MFARHAEITGQQWRCDGTSFEDGEPRPAQEALAIHCSWGLNGPPMSCTLTVYYSRKGENYWNGSIKNLPKGNTERVAEFVQQAVGGDLFEVDTAKDYPADYYECIDEAKAELKAKLGTSLSG